MPAAHPRRCPAPPARKGRNRDRARQAELRIRRGTMREQAPLQRKAGNAGARTQATHTSNSAVARRVERQPDGAIRNSAAGRRGDKVCQAILAPAFRARMCAECCHCRHGVNATARAPRASVMTAGRIAGTRPGDPRGKGRPGFGRGAARRRGFRTYDPRLQFGDAPAARAAAASQPEILAPTEEFLSSVEHGSRSAHL